ncbi:MAG TPA: hypothetical protein DEP24_07755 [Mycobacterium sp.]|nr:hypothetical protein [Mycobacterium sp.]
MGVSATGADVLGAGAAGAGLGAASAVGDEGAVGAAGAGSGEGAWVGKGGGAGGPTSFFDFGAGAASCLAASTSAVAGATLTPLAGAWIEVKNVSSSLTSAKDRVTLITGTFQV